MCVCVLGKEVACGCVRRHVDACVVLCSQYDIFANKGERWHTLRWLCLRNFNNRGRFKPYCGVACNQNMHLRWERSLI